MEDPSTNPLLVERHILVILVSGETGGFHHPSNANVIRYALNFLREHSSLEIQALAVGAKAATRCANATTISWANSSMFR